MDVKVYQINLDRDENGVAFISHGNLSKYQERPDVDASLYDKVFEGEIEAEDLEDVYKMFNMDKPEGFAGRSLSVSDVVEVVKSDEVKSGFYYCDSIGFQNVPFDSALAIESHIRSDRNAKRRIDSGAAAAESTPAVLLA